MRIPLLLATIAGSVIGTGAVAQTAPPPPPGGGMMRADIDHDGTITRAEMIADAQARFATMDTDKDGKVTAEERDAAREAMRAQRRGGTGGLRGGGMGGGGMGGGGMGGMRGDPDGVITREETARRAGARFDRLDANRDGKLDAAELAAARPMRGPRGGGDTPPPPSTLAQ